MLLVRAVAQCAGEWDSGAKGEKGVELAKCFNYQATGKAFSNSFSSLPLGADSLQLAFNKQLLILWVIVYM